MLKPPPTLTTQRLRLRQWQADDHAPFAALNANTQVMTYFPKRLASHESSHLAERLQQALITQGWGVWALALAESNRFIGIVGLQQLSNDLPFAPGVEILWRLHHDYWRQGFAVEAASAVLTFAFQQLQLSQVVAFTAALNRPSLALMQRLGMSNTNADFLHPKLAPSHPLAMHRLYQIRREQWLVPTTDMNIFS
ncbi:GNAT family N-acetyltransferase [Halioxenophilus sp. WMMB6]|uniref:GNAT family N-acetyltransferase n=1 Tax=Halioxenophilus sp. WMMB6 TaxID=3073815 RepID=UPI00295F0D97|nr:GNAT family N-acetyltransferase [Halioxenophilus sp. WMMB6]